MEDFSYASNPGNNNMSSRIQQPSHRMHQQVNSSSSLPPFDSPLAARTRPTSEIFLQTPLKQFGTSNGMNTIGPGGVSLGPGSGTNSALANHINPDDQMMDLAAEKWLADLELYQKTLEEMAEVSLDKNFKEELNDIERWFEVLSVGERTAALYALLQQTTPVQIRFFITVLQKIANRDPISAVLSPTNLEREPLQSQLNEAITRQQQGQQSNSSTSPSNKNISVSNGSTSSKGQSQHHLHQPQPHSAGFTQNYPHLHSPIPSGVGTSPFMTPPPKHDLYNNSFLGSFSKPIAPPISPWAAQEINRPKSADAPTGQNSQLHSLIQQQQLQGLQGFRQFGGAGSRLSNLSVTSNSSDTPSVGGGNSNTYKHNKSLSVLDDSLSSYLPDSSTNWSSIVNTPVSHIGTPQSKLNSEIINSTAMKMAALSTVNNRVVLDSDVKKFRRRGSLISNEDQKYIDRELQNLHIQANKHTSTNSPFASTPSPASWTLGISNNTTSTTNNTNNHNIGNGSPMPSNKHNISTSPQDRKSGLSKVSYGHQDSPSRDMTTSPAPLGTPKKDAPVDIELLQDIGAWLRSLRLHKYTDNLSDLNWKDLVELTDADLEKRGVNALGARRKMLKVFEQVKEAQQVGSI
ncbi:Vts1p [Sugiyamaella lignohabitans]|uniref:RNA-binding protein VTS1 n=1 Tax=Sugiyamaella lignohabitans TaxID=796027 RepID=A0A167ERC6_9ASCO|nr:Vts1p [Sugiyamaella lignohabitans]ANB14383.1 Vts1p [Sugiyamaella lignohabitans]